MNFLNEVKDFKFKKQLGQNFIFDDELLEFIAQSGSGCGNEIAIEVGAGAGSLTRHLSKAFKKVIAFEIDKELEKILKRTLNDCPNVELRFENALNIKIEDIDAMVNKPYALVANLPYYITTPLIFHFLASKNLNSMTVMTQLEVAQRIVSLSGKNFGALSASVQSLADAQILKIVKAQSFYPPPNVDSAILHLTKKTDSVYSGALYNFFKAAFYQKRKTVSNSLNAALKIPKSKTEQALQKLGFDINARAESLKVEGLAALAKILELI